MKNLFDNLIYSEFFNKGTGGGSGYKFEDFSYFCFNNCRLDSLEYIDTSEGTNFSNMFNGCSSVTSIPELNTANGTNFSSMFYNCSSLTGIPDLNTANGKYFNGMFSGCSSFTSIPELNTANGTNLSYLFYGCTNLKTVPELDTSNCTDFSFMFYRCLSLTSIPRIDMNKGTVCNSMLLSCPELTNLYLYNIRMSITIGSGTSYGHLLTVDSLVHTIKELCSSTSTCILTMGSANLEKIANLYCRVLDDTTEKIEMELCESTDEGAMTLAEYAALKNWSLA